MEKKETSPIFIAFALFFHFPFIFGYGDMAARFSAGGGMDDSYEDTHGDSGGLLLERVIASVIGKWEWRWGTCQRLFVIYWL